MLSRVPQRLARSMALLQEKGTFEQLSSSLQGPEAESGSVLGQDAGKGKWLGGRAWRVCGELGPLSRATRLKNLGNGGL